MKRALYFSTYFNPLENNRHFVMLYNALETLSAFQPFEFDVVVFCATPNKTDIIDYNHKGLYNLVQDFPWVKFYSSDFCENYSTKAYCQFMHKWYHLKIVFDLGYEQVFYTDADVVFLKSPEPIFQKYNQSHRLYMPRVSDDRCEKILETVWGLYGEDCYARSSSNWLLDKNTFNMLPGSYYDEIYNLMIEYIDAAEKLYGEQSIKTTPFSEQYAGVILFQRHSRIENWDSSGDDFAWGQEFELWNTDLTNVNVQKVKRDIIMWHYTSGSASLACRVDLLTDGMNKERKAKLDNISIQQTGLIPTSEESIRDVDNRALLSVDNEALRLYKEKRMMRL